MMKHPRKGVTAPAVVDVMCMNAFAFSQKPLSATRVFQLQLQRQKQSSLIRSGAVYTYFLPQSKKYG
jgi:hypothetical protein